MKDKRPYIRNAYFYNNKYQSLCIFLKQKGLQSDQQQ